MDEASSIHLVELNPKETNLNIRQSKPQQKLRATVSSQTDSQSTTYHLCKEVVIVDPFRCASRPHPK